MTYSLGIDLGQRVAIVLLDDRLKVRGHKCYEWTIDSFPRLRSPDTVDAPPSR